MEALSAGAGKHLGVRQALNMYDSALETSGLGKKQAPPKEAFQGSAASAAARKEAARAMHEVPPLQASSPSAQPTAVPA